MRERCPINYPCILNGACTKADVPFPAKDVAAAAEVGLIINETSPDIPTFRICAGMIRHGFALSDQARTAVTLQPQLPGMIAGLLSDAGLVKTHPQATTISVRNDVL